MRWLGRTMAINSETRQKVIEFLKVNKSLGHSEAARQLKAQGIEIKESTIRDYRRCYGLAYNREEFVVTAYVEKAVKQKRFVTAKELIKKFSISPNYASYLARRVEIDIKTVQAGFIKPVVADPMRGRKITRVGNVTRHVML
jgi:hypothetical protein